jgi:hypothetical protein
VKIIKAENYGKPALTFLGVEWQSSAGGEWQKGLRRIEKLYTKLKVTRDCYRFLTRKKKSKQMN